MIKKGLVFGLVLVGAIAFLIMLAPEKIKDTESETLMEGETDMGIVEDKVESLTEAKSAEPEGPLKHYMCFPGEGNFIFEDEKGNKDKAIRVWFYRPFEYDENSRILFVMHGVKRNGEHYRKQWITIAEEYNIFLVVPEFSQKHYPRSAKYNLGNVHNDLGELNEEKYWTFTAIENLFDYIKETVTNKNEKYYIYGHSAGGQFVHRLVMFKPDARIKKAVATNSGWYTMPSVEDKFPYGLEGSHVDSDFLG